MSSWRDQILREFIPQAAPLTLVADPDDLLSEESILQQIAERGFELITFEDHAAFRYAYESRFRSHWDRGEDSASAVVVRTRQTDLNSLPHDLFQAGRSISLSLADFFPQLSYPVIRTLERHHLDALWEAQQRQRPDRLGENESKDFVLRHVFGLAAELVRQPTDLLRVLLRRHHQGQRLPLLLDERLLEIWSGENAFHGWPLRAIVPDREAFFAFLQERWPIFLDAQAKEGDAMHQARPGYGLKVPGPEHLPFEHDDVRVVIDNLFLEGMLEAVSHPNAHRFADSWIAVGLRIDPASDQRRRWEGLLDTVAQSIPEQQARHSDWQSFSLRWAQLVALRHNLKTEPKSGPPNFDELQQQIDAAFLAWLRERYAALHSQPAVPPVMIHQVPRLLARRLEESSDAKAALVLVDGLSLDQWATVHEVLRIQRPMLQFRESCLFAWIPTLTMVSRQACFAGRAPFYFPSTIHNTNREPRLWESHWTAEGLAATEVQFRRGLRGRSSLREVEELTSHPKLRVIGLVVDQVDRIMHGMRLGAAGMHNQVRQWAEEGFLAELLDLLLDRRFSVFLASDHGNIEAAGCGRPSEGSIADQRGQRVRVYPDQMLRARVAKRFPDAIEWTPVGLPEDYLALIAPGRSAFVRKGDKLVCHGGITVEEVMVPFVQVEGK